MSFHINRLESQIQRTLSIVMLREARDEKFSQVTITRVILTKDLSSATCLFSTLHELKDPKAMIQSLNNLNPFLRKAIAENVKMRKIPELRFKYDNSFEAGNRIDRILEKIK